MSFQVVNEQLVSRLWPGMSGWQSLWPNRFVEDLVVLEQGSGGYVLDLLDCGLSEIVQRRLFFSGLVTQGNLLSSGPSC